MSAEIPKLPPPEHTGFFRSHRRTLAIIGGIGVIAAGAVGYNEARDYFSSSGTLAISNPADPRPADIDENHIVGSWNMHNETASRLDEIREFAETNKIDVLALQEVNKEDFELLKSEFENGWFLRYVLADTKQEVDAGGFGNVLMSRQKPEDVETLSIEGDSFNDTVTSTVASATKDVVSLSQDFPKAREVMRENRAAIAFTVQAYDGNQLKDIRVITTHIAGQLDVHSEQLQKLITFAKKNTKQDQPTILCGDLNGLKREIIPTFARIGYITPVTGPTLVSQRKTIDYCPYYEAGVLGLPEVTVSQKYKTDHHAILAKWVLRNNGWLYK